LHKSLVQRVTVLLGCVSSHCAQFHELTQVEPITQAGNRKNAPPSLEPLRT
jgi:hypothetical protein